MEAEFNTISLLQHGRPSFKFLLKQSIHICLMVSQRRLSPRKYLWKTQKLVSNYCTFLVP